ncbi:hypothetical protein JG687_00016783 [Phytophthora cactorum]|uniref:Uncharacterized protein n=1 Tax=Phytophthora cactorum TaxID=29920 RepID=A0A329RA72_9STRA|nr:hypothetical protein PC112_g24635 [Phytophthora cactorum]KAG2791456.1 hypothetical protein PC111_g23915 [Phytophthora cactorum]KAG2802451.1 hypothetical protein PC113_g24485 [Phytophthora cactorum]KAG2868607.1 hypothetical protein PC114_g27818 [Phytophthora cactorum]KAG2872208.1 hypothetical protein PC115_g24665 [Phytophthora cactorum]
MDIKQTIDDKEYDSAITAYQSISRDYSGNLAELTSKYKSQIKDLTHDRDNSQE